MFQRVANTRRWKSLEAISEAAYHKSIKAIRGGLPKEGAFKLTLKDGEELAKIHEWGEEARQKEGIVGGPGRS